LGEQNQHRNQRALSAGSGNALFVLRIYRALVSVLMEITDDNTLYLGQDRSSTSGSFIALSQEDRRRHIYALGQTGSGKTTFLLSLAIQDIEQGRGLCVLDPHGDLAEIIIDSIPRHRVRDVVYLNPTDTEHPIGFNPLADIPPEQRPVAVANMIAAFRSIWRESWGPRMEHILANVLAVLVEQDRSNPVSLLSIAPMLTNDRYRRTLISRVSDPVVRDFWNHEFASYDRRMRAEIIAPILNKIGAFGRHPIMRNILGQGRNGFDLGHVMDERKILVVNLSKGLLGEDMTNLFGSLLVCAIQQQAMRRARIPEDDRVDFHLLIDEFQNFTTDAFDGIVSEARKYRLCLACANQYSAQLKPNILAAVLGNMGTLALFALSGEDAERFESEFAPYTATTLRSNRRGEMTLKTLADGERLPPSMGASLFGHEPLASRERVVRNCRTRFAKDRRQVEDGIHRYLHRLN